MRRISQKEINASLEARVMALLVMCQIDRKELARAFGVTQSAITARFAGRTRFTVDDITALKQMLPNLSLDWLLLGRGDIWQ